MSDQPVTKLTIEKLPYPVYDAARPFIRQTFTGTGGLLDGAWRTVYTDRLGRRAAVYHPTLPDALQCLDGNCPIGHPAVDVAQ